ncbi:MAG: class I SAM-dependent methyltransferase [Bryobacteraceae bacterium]|nr:class I SAM-dependent methyltransferase [Bryobacteraceae bacterium]
MASFMAAGQSPADITIYEEYRRWRNAEGAALPQGDPGEKQYREWLVRKGVSATDADAQVRTIQALGDKGETARWNRILTAPRPTFNTNSNHFLTEIAKTRKPGTALDVGMGQGRNGIWLAQQGWQVTGFDPAEQAVALAQKTAAEAGTRLTTMVRRSEDFDFGENRWDLILISYAGGRDLTEKVTRALRPGGVLIITGFHRDATKGRSIGGGVVFDTGELPSLFPKLRVLRYEEPIGRADFGMERVRLVNYAAEKPAE